MRLVFGLRPWVYRVTAGFVFFIVFLAFRGRANGIKERFAGETELRYSVSAAGMPSGEIVWKYEGSDQINGKKVDILSVNSDTRILTFFEMVSEEKVYLDSENFLPHKVERDLVVSGRPEKIVERYDQKQGRIFIAKGNGDVEETVLEQDPPIQNILSLLYFFPADVDLSVEEWVDFNLPTQKLRILPRGERPLRIGSEVRQTYFLIGRGARRFSLWLDKETRSPLRIEFIFLLGKITITRK